MQEGPGKGGQSLEDETAQRCPICLNRPRQADRAVPDCCTHVYCSACILRWAQIVQSCPVDRRPISVIYLQGSSQQCIKLPVKVPRLSECDTCSDQDSPVMCHVSVEENKRMQEKRLHAKQKRHNRKCHSEEFVNKNRKINGDSCHTVLSSQHFHSSLPSQQGATVGTVTHIITNESVEVCEELPDELQWRRLQRKSRWLPESTPDFFTGVPRVSLQSHLLMSAVFTSLSILQSEDSVSFGRVCAVTCPKGEERKGSRGSGSKSSAKSTKGVATRRSSRHNRTETGDNAAEQSQSSNSDTSSSTNHSTTPEIVSETSASSSDGQQDGNERVIANKDEDCAEKASLEERQDEQKSEPGNHEDEDEVSKEEESEETEADQDAKEAESSSEGNNDPEPTDDPEATDDLEQKMDEEEEKSLGESECASPDVNNHDEDTTTMEEKSSLSTVDHEDNQELSPGDMLENKQIVGKCDESQESLNVSLGEEEDSPPPSCASLQELESGSQNIERAAEVSTDVSNKVSDVEQEPETTTVEDLQQESLSLLDQSTSLSDQQLPSVAQGNAISETLDTNAESHQDNTDLIPMDCDSPLSENEGHATDETDSSANVPQLPSQEHKSESYKEEKGSDKREGRSRRSRFHSPTTNWSPVKESRSERSCRSRSRSRGRSSKTHSGSKSGEQQEDERDGRRNHSRERSRSRDRSHRRRSRSRSRSRTRNWTGRRSPSQEHLDHSGRSPQKRESWGGDGWRNRGGGRGFRNSNWRNNSEKQGHFSTREPNLSNNGSFREASPDWVRNENPDWVRERTLADTDARGREPRREENTADPPGESWQRGGWNVEQGQRSAGRGRGSHWSSSSQQADQADNWRQRTSFSGTANNTDSYNRFNENRAGVKRKELEGSDMPMDRSGWSTASSWAVRRTLPADVQNYYSRRDRGGSNVWNKQEEDQSLTGVSKQTDLPQNEPKPPISNEAVPQPLPALMPHQLGMVGVLRYPMPPLIPRAPAPVLQPAQFMPPPVPVHLHPAGALLQVPSIAVQGLPPPPPPPPPVQQGGFTVSTEIHMPQQVMPNFSIPVKPFKPMPTKVSAAPPHPAGTLSVAQPSSTTPQPTSHSKAHADSSKKEKKLQIQERAVSEVKAAIKPYYQKNEINKDEYKEIVRKAVEKVCHSKSGEVNADKVANLVKAYVDKYKRVRKNKSEKS